MEKGGVESRTAWQVAYMVFDAMGQSNLTEQFSADAEAVGIYRTDFSVGIGDSGYLANGVR